MGALLRTFLIRSTTVIAASSLLSACVQGSSVPFSPSIVAGVAHAVLIHSTSSFFGVDAASLVFAAERNDQTISVYNTRGARVASIKTSIGPLATDREGDLYVAPNQGSEVLKIFAPPYTRSPSVIHLNNQLVEGVAVDPQTGVFAVVSLTAGSFGSKSNVSFFKHGSHTPCRVVAQPNESEKLFGAAAFDHEGTLFLSSANNQNSAPSIAIMSGQCGKGEKSLASFSQPLLDIAHIAFNRDDNLVLQSDPESKVAPIYTYLHPNDNVFGKPIETTLLQPDQGYSPHYLSLASDGMHVWADYVASNLGSYNYPGGGLRLKTLGAKPVEFAAISPPLTP